jgi:transposase
LPEIDSEHPFAFQVPTWREFGFEAEYAVMGAEQEAGTGRRPRRWRTVSEKRRIAEQTFEPGASVALVARAHGVNANQVFKWRRALKRGELNEATGSAALLPVTVSAASVTADAPREVDAREQSASGGSIHIEFPGLAMISVERGAAPSLLRSILESLRK